MSIADGSVLLTEQLRVRAMAYGNGDDHARRDVVIGGAGFAGLALAIALRQALGRRVHGRRSPIRRWGAAKSKDPRAPRSRPRRGGCSRRSKSGRRSRRRAADSRHGGDQLQARRRGAADLPHLRRRSGDRAKPFAHMIENRHLIDALVTRRGTLGVDLRAPRSTVSRRRTRSMSSLPMARRYRRGFWSAPTARARRSASRPASPRMAGTTTSRRSSPPSRMSASTTAAPRSISCPPGRSRSCR